MANNNEMNSWVGQRMARLSPDGEWRPDAAGAYARFKQRLSSRKRTGKNWGWAVAAATTAAACLIAFPQPRAAAQRVCVNTCEALIPNARAGRVVGALRAWAGMAPDFMLTDAAGAEFRLSDYKGKVVLLSFWATWCPPCKTEIPWFQEFQHSYMDRGLAVIGVSMDEAGWKSVKPFIEAGKIDYRIAIADKAVAEGYDVEALPMTLLIDREGRIAARFTGITKKNDYEIGIARLLGE